MKLTGKQKEFLLSKKDHVDYVNVEKRWRTAQALERAGLVKLSGAGLFAHFTETGLEELRKLKEAAK